MSRKAYRLMSTLILANIFSVTAMSAAYATEGPGNPTDGTGRSHAGAAPACGDQRPVLAGDGPPGVGDNNGRSMASVTGRSGQVPALWRPVLASAEGLGSAGDQTGRGAEGGRGGIGGDV